MTANSIVFCADHNYLPYLGVAAHTLLESNPGLKPVLYIVTDRHPDPGNLERLELLSRRHGVTVNIYAMTAQDREELSGLSASGHFTVATYFRLLIPRALPQSVHTVLYLDADMLVSGDLSGLLGTDVSAVALAACVDPVGRQVSGNAHYFNTGTMLINLDYWRERDVTGHALAYARQHKPRFCDQDALNAVIPAADRRLLSLEYNYMIYDRLKGQYRHDLDAVLGAVRQPKILHYTGANKPWHAWFLAQHRDQYLEALRASPWHDLPGILKEKPETPRQEFWLGEVVEATGDVAQAAAHYKRAALGLWK